MTTAGVAPLNSHPNPARPAPKRTTKHQENSVLTRLAVDALVHRSEILGAPMRRKSARAIVQAYNADQDAVLDGWSFWLRDWFDNRDVTGETATRRVHRERVTPLGVAGERGGRDDC